MFIFTKMLLIFYLLPAVAVAVNIRNYNRVNCQGRYEQCSNINENVCCDRSAGSSRNNDTSFASSAHTGLPATGLALACQSLGRSQHCGQVVDASWGDSACAGRGSDLSGSFWFTCLGCPFPPPAGGNGTTNSTTIGGGSAEEEAFYDDALSEGQAQADAKNLVAVKPDLISIDGHLFEINYAVPENITREFYRVYDDLNLDFNDLSDSLRSREVIIIKVQ